MSRDTPTRSHTAVVLLATVGVTLALVTVFASAPAWTKRDRSEARYVAGELLLKYKEGTSRDPFPRNVSVALASKYGLKSVEQFPRFGIELVQVSRETRPDSLAQRLREEPAIRFAEPNYIIGASAEQLPDDYNPKTHWGLERIGMPQAWSFDDAQKPGSVIVAVLDTGVDARHRDLAGGIVMAGMSFCTDTTDGENPKPLKADPDVKDVVGHGTHVAGIIAARRNNKFGIAGIASNVLILPVKILCNGDTGTVADAVRGMAWALDQKAGIINLSWTTQMKSEALEAMIEVAAQAKVLVVAAAGNGPGDIEKGVYPAAAKPGPYFLTVAAIDEKDKLASFSNWNPTLVQIAAPGTNIVSITPNDKTDSFSGTSMSTAHVTGCAALLKRLARLQGRDLAGDQIKALLLTTADKVNVERVQEGRRLNCGRAAAQKP